MPSDFPDRSDRHSTDSPGVVGRAGRRNGRYHAVPSAARGARALSRARLDAHGSAGGCATFRRARDSRAKLSRFRGRPRQPRARERGEAGALARRMAAEAGRATDYQLYMRAEPDGLITVGLLGSRAALRPLIDRYAAYARRIQLPLRSRPEESLSTAAAVHYYPLMMSFDREGLARAAALALTEPPRLDLDPNLTRNNLPRPLTRMFRPQ